MSLNQKELVEELRFQWKKLWKERVDDKMKAEGVAADDYLPLFVEKGTVIHATRDFKALSFKEILEQHLVENVDKYVSPSPYVGGWNKFVKMKISGQSKRRSTRTSLCCESKKKKQQPKKSGRGWLHL